MKRVVAARNPLYDLVVVMANRTPSQYAALYQEIPVPLDGKSAVVKVTEYLNPGPRVKYRWRDYSDAHWQKVYSVYIRHVAGKDKHSAFGKAFSSSVDAGSPQRVHKGYAAPGEIRAILQLAALYWGEMGLGGKFDASHSLQDYVDQWIGLFCTGFAGNFVRHELGDQDVRGDTAIPDFAKEFFRRTDQDSISAADLMVWKNGFHIAVIDRVWYGTGGVWLRVAESSQDTAYKGLTANGRTGKDKAPAENDYLVLGYNKTEWTVRRGLNSYQEPQVYIVDPIFPDGSIFA